MIPLAQFLTFTPRFLWPEFAYKSKSNNLFDCHIFHFHLTDHWLFSTSIRDGRFPLCRYRVYLQIFLPLCVPTNCSEWTVKRCCLPLSFIVQSYLLGPTLTKPPAYPAIQLRTKTLHTGWFYHFLSGLSPNFSGQFFGLSIWLVHFSNGLFQMYPVINKIFE